MHMLHIRKMQLSFSGWLMCFGGEKMRHNNIIMSLIHFRFTILFLHEESNSCTQLCLELYVFRSWNVSKLNELGRKVQIETMETNIMDFSGTEQMDSDDFSIVVPALPMFSIISSRNVRCSQDFGNSSPSRVTCRSTSDSIPLPGNKKAFGAVGWRSSFRYFIQDVRRKKNMEEGGREL